MSRNWIEFPRMEGATSRQAHADLPDGTFERDEAPGATFS